MRRSTATLLCILVVLLIAVVLSRSVLITLPYEGLVALLVCIAGGLTGFVVPFPAGFDRLPSSVRICLRLCLGLGISALITMLTGHAITSTRAVQIQLVVGAAIGLIACIRNLPAPDRNPRGRFPRSALLLLPFAALALAAAAQAPGFLWAEEGYGYDILEYHLQVPREYLQNGMITYLPHNVYASFPMNVEMLYLQAMAMTSDHVNAGVAANYIHLILGVLFVLAIWSAGRAFSRRAGILAAILAGTTGWGIYLSGLAYVELGLLCFAAASCAVMCWRAIGRLPAISTPVISGLFCGLSCGCKYTAVPMFGLPLTLGWFLLPASGTVARLRSSLAFVAGMLLTFSPWLIVNALATGNPVFPLAQGVFEARPEGWNSHSQERWDAGHSADPAESDTPGRISAFVRRVLVDAPFHRLGYALWLGAAFSLLGRRDRMTLILWLMIGIQIVVWLSVTHLFARFAVVLMVPMSILGGLCLAPGPTEKDMEAEEEASDASEPRQDAEPAPTPPGSHGLPERSSGSWKPVALLLAAGLNLVFASDMYSREIGFGSVCMADWVVRGDHPMFPWLGVINESLPSTARVLMVGESRAWYVKPTCAYTVAFNVQPLGEVAGSSELALGWLKQRGFTHVLVVWSEIARLRGSRYGFDPRITPELFLGMESLGLKHVAGADPDPRRPAAPPAWVLFEVPSPSGR